MTRFKFFFMELPRKVKILFKQYCCLKKRFQKCIFGIITMVIKSNMRNKTNLIF